MTPFLYRITILPRINEVIMSTSSKYSFVLIPQNKNGTTFMAKEVKLFAIYGESAPLNEALVDTIHDSLPSATDMVALNLRGPNGDKNLLHLAESDELPPVGAARRDNQMQYTTEGTEVQGFRLCKTYRYDKKEAIWYAMQAYIKIRRKHVKGNVADALKRMHSYETKRILLRKATYEYNTKRQKLHRNEATLGSITEQMNKLEEESNRLRKENEELAAVEAPPEEVDDADIESFLS